MNVDADQLKRAAAEAAFEYIHSGMVLGLGTGSTVRPLLKLLNVRVDKKRPVDETGPKDDDAPSLQGCV